MYNISVDQLLILYVFFVIIECRVGPNLFTPLITLPILCSDHGPFMRSLVYSSIWTDDKRILTPFFELITILVTNMKLLTQKDLLINSVESNKQQNFERDYMQLNTDGDWWYDWQWKLWQLWKNKKWFSQEMEQIVIVFTD